MINKEAMTNFTCPPHTYVPISYVMVQNKDSFGKGTPKLKWVVETKLCTKCMNMVDNREGLPRGSHTQPAR